MSQTNFDVRFYSEILEFISEKNKIIVPDKISLQEVKSELEKSLNEVMDDLCVRFIHKDYWPDNDDIQQIHEYISFIEDKIKENK